jgi:YggT family protein
VTIGRLILDLLQLYSLLVFIRAIMSWVRPDPRNRFVQILNTLTDPVLVPIQKVIPPIGGTVDISPWVAILALHLLGRVVVSVF